jgi:hypothetical protein
MRNRPTVADLQALAEFPLADKELAFRQTVAAQRFVLVELGNEIGKEVGLRFETEAKSGLARCDG